ncbi:MAG: hypothetical protein PHG69_00965 [Candidatus Omnitrophica bacterium]|nr:hypothetical protein [Candidatus Omnitrophota bacterium]
MKNINHLVQIVSQTHHLSAPALLSLFLGLIVIKKRPSVFFNEDEAVGDNIPTSLMDGLNA